MHNPDCVQRERRCSCESTRPTVRKRQLARRSVAEVFQPCRKGGRPRLLLAKLLRGSMGIESPTAPTDRTIITSGRLGEFLRRVVVETIINFIFTCFPSQCRFLLTRFWASLALSANRLSSKVVPPWTAPDVRWLYAL